MKYRRLLIGVVATLATVALVIGTWFLARTVQSPAQREAAAAPPSMQPITIPATRGNLIDQITATGSVATEQETTITIPMTDGASVVTASSVAVGQTLQAGQVLLRINGRPLIALPGAFPAYRDLTQGDRGDDVRQLQESLVSLGYAIVIDGEFGSATAQAVAHLYRDLGFDPLTAQRAENNKAASDKADKTSASSTSDDAQDTPPSSHTTAKKSATAVLVPRNEIVYIPQMDQYGTVTSIPAVGTVLSESTASIIVTSGSARIKAEVPGSTAQSLTPRSHRDREYRRR